MQKARANLHLEWATATALGKEDQLGSPILGKEREVYQLRQGALSQHSQPLFRWQVNPAFQEMDKAFAKAEVCGQGQDVPYYFTSTQAFQKARVADSLNHHLPRMGTLGMGMTDFINSKILRTADLPQPPVINPPFPPVRKKLQWWINAQTPPLTS